jgi:hypothetical protein
MHFFHVPGTQSRNMFVNFAATLTLVLALIGSAFTQNTLQLKVSPNDRAAVASSSHFWYHARAARTATAQSAPRALLTAARPKMTGIKTAAASTVPNLPPPGVYPDDLTYFGGAVVTSLVSHNLFVNCTNSCWGNPNRFLTNLGSSNFIHVVDQYTGSTANNRYTLGTSASVAANLLTNVASVNDILLILHAAAKSMGSGYGHEYQVFLPKGVDTCFDPPNSNICYSPDNIPTFFFCAYHGSVDFSDSVGHVLFSVEPYQAVDGCAVTTPAPNGRLADSTANVLSHELIETITDPDGTAWVAVNTLPVLGAEIGDECEPPSLTAPLFDPPVSNLNGHNWKIQLEYSNFYHACANVP